MRYIKRFIYSVAILVPVMVSAEAMPEYNLTIQSLFAIISGLACWMARMAYLIMIVMLVYWAIQFFLSKGEPAKYEKAKTGFKYALIGIAVVLATYIIIATVAISVGLTDVSQFLPLSC